jgi:hypothetical protein
MVERRQFSLRRRCRLALQAALGYTFWLSAVAVFFKARLGRSGRATPAQPPDALHPSQQTGRLTDADRSRQGKRAF